MSRLKIAPEFVTDLMQPPKKQPEAQPVDVVRHPGGDAEQVAQPAVRHVQSLVQLTGSRRRIISHPRVPSSLAESVTHTGYSQRPYFKAQHIEPLRTGAILRMTVPDKSRSSKQRYVLTEAGIKLRTWHADQQQANTQRTNRHEND